jgi:hypothetical protein
MTARKRSVEPPPRTTAAQSTTPQRDGASGSAAASDRAAGGGYAGMKLPHERDESAERDPSLSQGGEVRPVIDQAATDVESGQRDTDCYTANAPRYRKQEHKRR